MTEYDHLLGDWEVDSDRVQSALEAAVEWYHGQLDRTIHYPHITEKWGISAEMIDKVKIGWSSDGNGVVYHLRDEGYSEVEIAAATIRTVTELKHVFRCTPGSEDCNHYRMPDDIDALAKAVDEGEVSSDEVNVKAVIGRAQETDSHYVADWWENRLVFPYRDAEGNVRYMIGRKTPKSNDVPNKYLKHQVREYTDEEVVYEPIYGVPDLPANPEYIVLTEGITDAIMAHQHSIPCIAPVTKQFKSAHHGRLKRLTERAEQVYVANDSEKGDEGLAGALRTADYLRENGVDAYVGEFPRGEDEKKVDMADYLAEHCREQFEQEVLEKAILPGEHPKYSEYVTDDEYVADDGTDKSSGGGRSAEVDRNEHEGDAKSALFDLDLVDVANVSVGDRGKNPLGHHGGTKPYSEDYYVVRNDDFAYDHKYQVGYVGLTHLLVEAGRRPASSPKGSLSDADVMVAWVHAKENGYLGRDDPCPSAGLRHVAREHTPLPDQHVDQYPDFRWPAEVYNRVLDRIEEEYGVSAGRERLETSERDEKEADVMMGEDEEEQEDERIEALKQVLALSSDDE